MEAFIEFIEPYEVLIFCAMIAAVFTGVVAAIDHDMRKRQ